MSIKLTLNECCDKNNLSLYQLEIAKKEKQIISLQNKINNLLLNKYSLISKIDKSKSNNILSLKNISHLNNYSNNNLLLSFQPMHFEDSIFRKNLNEKIGDKYNNTFEYKLLSAQKEIQNLTIMNTTKDKIIIIIQNFINNLNNIVCNGKINLNINQVDIKTFNANVKELELKIIRKLQKINKSNKIPDSIIKKVKEKSIRKLRTEVTLTKKKHLFKIPLNKQLNTQTSINESEYSNTSVKNQNITFQNYPKKITNELKNINNKIGRNKSIQNKKYKENTSLDNKYYNECLKTINNEMSFSRLLI